MVQSTLSELNAAVVEYVTQVEARIALEASKKEASGAESGQAGVA